MDDLLASFLSESRKDVVRDTGSGAHLAVFGKHPGWDDHMEDIDVVTPSLAGLKTMLYYGGISRQIDSGAWKELPPSASLDGFHHLFLWCGPRGLLLGRLWNSQDGKGRSAYPMIAVCHFLTSEFPPNLDLLLPPLEQFEAKVRETDSREDVRKAQQAARQEILNLCASSTGAPAAANLAAERRALLDADVMGPDREGFYRVLHAIRSQMESYAPGSSRRRNQDPLPQQIRVPVCIEPIGKSMQHWHQLVASQLSPGTHILLTRHLDEDWLDITVGLPGDDEWFRLKAGSERIPMTSAIEYTIDSEQRSRFRKTIEAFELGSSELPSIWDDGAGERGSGFFGNLFKYFTKKKD